MNLVQGTTGAQWRQFVLPKYFEAEALTRRKTISTAQQDECISDIARTSFVRSDSSGPTLIGNGNEPQVNPRNILDRRSSNPVPGRSLPISSTTPPARPPSRTQSVHSEVSEYGPDRKLIKTKTITTTYSAEAISHSHIQTPNQTQTRRRASLFLP